LTLTDNSKKVLGNLLSVYATGLKNNITTCFDDCLSVLTSFSILSPVALRKPASPEFKEYGNNEIKTLANHFFKEKEKKEEEIMAAKLQAEWVEFKFDLHSWKGVIPSFVHRSSTTAKK